MDGDISLDIERLALQRKEAEAARAAADKRREDARKYEASWDAVSGFRGDDIGTWEAKVSELAVELERRDHDFHILELYDDLKPIEDKSMFRGRWWAAVALHAACWCPEPSTTVADALKSARENGIDIGNGFDDLKGAVLSLAELGVPPCPKELSVERIVVAIGPQRGSSESTLRRKLRLALLPNDIAKLRAVKPDETTDVDQSGQGNYAENRGLRHPDRDHQRQLLAAIRESLKIPKKDENSSGVKSSKSKRRSGDVPSSNIASR